jgi:predicted amidohydrolase
VLPVRTVGWPAPGLLVVDLDPAEVDGVRRSIPVLANRRF